MMIDRNKTKKGRCLGALRFAVHSAIFLPQNLEFAIKQPLMGEICAEERGGKHACSLIVPGGVGDHPDLAVERRGVFGKADLVRQPGQHVGARVARPHVAEVGARAGVLKVSPDRRRIAFPAGKEVHGSGAQKKVLLALAFAPDAEQSGTKAKLEQH
jgi:hypothetical protein